jgi:hypothetical protein
MTNPNITILNQQRDALGLHEIWTCVYWIPVVAAAAQVPVPGFTSQVPLQSGAQSPYWQANGITSAMLTNLQLGSYVEKVATLTIPICMFADGGAALLQDNAWRVLYAQVNGGTATPPPTLLPSSVSYEAYQAAITTTTVAAGSNGASLPQSTISLASTTGFPTSGTSFIPASQSSGPQAGQIVVQSITYTGISGNNLTGCTGGAGVLFTGGIVDVQAWTAA